MKIYINGKYFDKDEAKVSVFDHGFLYGDGIFEGIRLYSKCVFKLDEHLERLEYSAKSILLKLPWKRSEIAEAVLETCRQNNLTNGYIRLIVTRGVGSLGLKPHECKDPQLIIIADNIKLYPQEYYDNGLKVVTVPTRRMNQTALPPMVKSLNYLNNIFAKIEAMQSGCEEAIMLNEQGFVVEGTGDNIFIYHKGTIFTPSTYSGALAGITRSTIMDFCKKHDIPVVETSLTRYDLWNAEECFLTGTAAEVIPVIEADGRMIGDGKPGKITNILLKDFRQLVVQEGVFL